jgi:glycosyltransferase involved in cell wall biosynthesis
MHSARSLRLTLVTETFPPEINGVARTLGQWVAAFRERGHSVTVIRPRQPAEAAVPEHVHGVPLPFYPQLRFGIASPSRVRGKLLRSAPDLIHIATEGPLGAAALMAAGSLGVPVVSSFHTNFDQYLSHYGLAGLETAAAAYLAWFHNLTQLTLAPSQAACARLSSIGVRRTAIWGRGVDGDMFHPSHRDLELRRQWGLADDDVLLMYVGRLAAEKNLGALLDAFERLRRGTNPRADRIRLALVGNGPLAPTLHARQLPGVILAGEKRGHELSRWYASADLFAFPSKSETFGNAVLEAKSSGLPVVGFDCQAVSERIEHGIDGLLVPVGGDFAKALGELCADQEMRSTFACAARRSAELHSWTAIFDDLERLYYQHASSSENTEPVYAGMQTS